MEGEGITSSVLPVVEPADETTRYLAAAVHLDDRLADLVVDEFLSEAKRAVPPSPGVHTETVLREAIAAQASRRILNGVMVGLFSVTVLLAFPFVVCWLLSGLLWMFCSFVVTKVASLGALSNSPGRRRARWWFTAWLWMLLSGLFVWFPAAVSTIAGAALSMNDSPLVVATVGLSILAPAIYVAMAIQYGLPWRIVTSRYMYGVFQSDMPPRDFVSRACAPYTQRLWRISQDEARRAAMGGCEVTVYRGRRPFVGAGTPVRRWATALELEVRDPQADGMPTFQPSELHNYVADQVETLRKATNLSPGGRLAALGSTQCVLLSASHMLHFPSASPLLAQLDACGDPQLSEQNWSELADNSPEWLRYYRCFRLEGWERQLAVSGYLHVGCSERMLYLEWHGCVLPPVDNAFRQVDKPPAAAELRAAWQALGALALFPLSVPARVVDVFRGLQQRAGPRAGSWSTPAEGEQVYGTAASLRELGAGRQPDNFFQDSDCDRYLKILETQVLEAIRNFLYERGLVAKGLDGMVSHINNSTVLTNCAVTAGSIGGQDNSGTVSGGDNESGVDPNGS